MNLDEIDKYLAKNDITPPDGVWYGIIHPKWYKIIMLWEKYLKFIDRRKARKNRNI